ncbi:hypothetical protein [Achromobacter kerstersii]
MPYIDPTGISLGWSDIPQPVFNFTHWVDEAPALAPVVPPSVSRFQGREAMWQTPHGDTTLFEAAEAVLADPDTPAMYRRAWDDLQEFRRDSEMLAAVAGMLGLTAAQIDALFFLAASIQA